MNGRERGPIIMGDKDTSWKISVKNEDDLFMDKHKPGKIRKVFSGVFVFVCFAILLYVGYETFLHKEPDRFKKYLEKGDYLSAEKIFDYSKDYTTLVEKILDKKMEYDKNKDKENFDEMWDLIFRFESQIRVSDKSLYTDLKYFPKEKKVVKVGCLKEVFGGIWYLEEYYETMLKEADLEDNQLYNYYIDIEMVIVENKNKIDEDIDVIIKNNGYEVLNKRSDYVKKFVEIVEQEYQLEGEYGEYIY